MRASRCLGLLTFCVLWGCPETKRCNPGWVRGPGDHCVPADGAVASDTGLCGTCSGATPHCDEGRGACVECVSESDCAGEARYCVSSQCVECMGAGDCREGSASRCELGQCMGCQEDADCGHLESTTVCDVPSHTCVQCASGRDDACGEYVCDASMHRCTTLRKGSAGVCDECRWDGECQEGQLCVPMTFGGMAVGQHCLWRRDAVMGSACSLKPPYVQALEATSVEGVQATVCTLAVSTCAAHDDFRAVSCTASSTPPTADEACGAPGVADGYCRAVDSATNLCTVGCTSFLDCPCTDGMCMSQYACAEGFCTFTAHTGM